MPHQRYLSKPEQNRRFKFRCEHNRDGFAHPRCYERAVAEPEVVGFLDIETSNLNASYGICYCYCLKKLEGGLVKRTVTLKELYDGEQDKGLLKQFYKDTEDYDRLVLHYGIDRKFDLPFLRTRAIKHNLPFPEHKFIWVNDTQVIARNKLKMHSNDLAIASAQLWGISLILGFFFSTSFPKSLKHAIQFTLTNWWITSSVSILCLKVR